MHGPVLSRLSLLFHLPHKTVFIITFMNQIFFLNALLHILVVLLPITSFNANDTKLNLNVSYSEAEEATKFADRNAAGNTWVPAYRVAKVCRDYNQSSVRRTPGRS